MYECFHCGTKSVVWDSDFDFEDYGLEGEGIVHVCHCGNCGARITYEVPCEAIHKALMEIGQQIVRGFLDGIGNEEGQHV